MRLPPDLDRRYELLGAIREGGMGAVYKVRHRDLKRVMVAKTLLLPKNASAQDQEELRERFRREARLASRLTHPNIAQILDLSQDGEWIVMEYVDGPTIRDLLESGTLPIALSLEIAQQTLRALAYLHRHGTVHRDISPENLMVTRDPEGAPLVKMIDLGIARAVAETEHQLTGKGGFIGKPLYASPEHLNDLEPIDGRSDLYSIAVVLYELLTGVHPLLGRSPRPGQSQRPADFILSDPEGRIPPDLQIILLTALEEDPEKRFSSAQELAASLATIQARFPLEPGDVKGLRGRAPGAPGVPPPPEHGETTRPERLGQPGRSLETRRSPRAPSNETRVAALAPDVPLSGMPTAVSPPAVPSPPASRPSATQSVTSERARRPNPPSQKSRKRRWPAAFLILTGLLVGGYWVWTNWPLEALHPADRDAPKVVEPTPADASVSDSGGWRQPAAKSRTAGNREEAAGNLPPGQVSPAIPETDFPDRPDASKHMEPPPVGIAPAETPFREPAASPESGTDLAAKVPSSPAKEPDPAGRGAVRPRDEPTVQRQERRKRAPVAPPAQPQTRRFESEDNGEGAPKRKPQEERAPTKKRRTIEGGAEFFDSEPALLLASPQAIYPEAARGSGTYAEIMVGFWIDETGAVADPRIERSRVKGAASAALFEEAALSAARKARFQPMMERGIPVRSWNSLSFTFEAN